VECLRTANNARCGTPAAASTSPIPTTGSVRPMLLYNSPVSGDCYKVRLLLAHLGIEYETAELSVVDRSNRAEVLGGLHPGLRVPTLVLDDGRPLAESNAILWYFGDGTRYVPADRTNALRCCSGCSSSRTDHEEHFHLLREDEGVSQRSECPSRPSRLRPRTTSVLPERPIAKRGMAFGAPGMVGALRGHPACRVSLSRLNCSASSLFRP
jgi:hypothetical protein